MEELILDVVIFSLVWVLLEVLYNLLKPYILKMMDYIEAYMPPVDVIEKVLIGGEARR